MQRILRCLYSEGYHIKYSAEKISRQILYFSLENGDAKIAYEGKLCSLHSFNDPGCSIQNTISDYSSSFWFHVRILFMPSMQIHSCRCVCDGSKGIKFIYDAMVWTKPGTLEKMDSKRRSRDDYHRRCRFSSRRITVGNMLTDLLKKRYNKDFTVIHRIPDTAVTPSQINARKDNLVSRVLNIGRGLKWNHSLYAIITGI